MFSGMDGGFGWKPIPSEARVTRDEVSGFIEHIVTAVLDYLQQEIIRDNHCAQQAPKIQQHT